MNTLTTHDQTPAVAAMLAMVTTFGHLPAVNMALEAGSESWGVRIDVHRDISGFELWREALNVAPADVEQDAAGALGWLKLRTTFAGVPVEMYGYFHRPVSEDDE